MEQQVAKLKKEYFSVNHRKRLLLAGLAAGVVLAILWSLHVGPAAVDLKTVWAVLWDLFEHNDALTNGQRVIVLRVRMPRIAASILVGVLLANSGLLMQAIGRKARNSTRSLLLAGVAVSYLFSSLVSFIKYVVDVKKLPELVFWQMGSVSDVTWPQIGLLLATAVIGFFVMTFYAWDLNVMATGKESAISLGVNYKRVRRVAFFFSTLMTGVADAFAGTIGFVGMVAPHAARMLVGNDYRYTVPTASLCGALLLLVADALSRMLVTAIALPIGVITSMIGVPFFIWLIVQKRQEV